MKASEQSRPEQTTQQAGAANQQNSNKRGNNNNNNNMCVYVCVYSVCNQDSHINCKKATAIYIDTLYSK